MWGDIARQFGLKRQSWQSWLVFTREWQRNGWAGSGSGRRSRRGGFVFSDSRCQHFFSLGETEGSRGDEISPKPRIGVFVYFELCTDTVGLQSAKIVRRASKEEVEHFFFGPRVEYKVIPEHISDCTRKRKRRLPISSLAAADLFLDV